MKVASLLGRSRGQIARAVLVLAIGSAWLLGAAQNANATLQDDAAAAKFHSKRWSIAEGLPQSSVNEIVQTGEGELWIATFGGLASFDGLRFRNFDLGTSAGLPSCRITAMVSDGAGGLWVATQNDGVVRFRDGRVVETTPALPEQVEIIVLVSDAAGGLWLRSSGGAVYHLEAQAWKCVIPALASARYNSFALASDGSLLLVNADRLHRHDANGVLLESLAAPARINCLAIGPQGEVLLGVQGGIVRVNDSRLEPLRIEPALLGGVVALLPLDDRRIWVGTPEGPVLLVRQAEQDEFHLQPQPVGLSKGFDVRSMLLDREGNLWAGSPSQGLIRLSPHGLGQVSFAGLLKSVTALAPAAQGRAWVASDCSGIGLIEMGADQATSAPLPSLHGTAACVRSLLMDTRGRLWIGTQSGVLRMEAGVVLELPIDAKGDPIGPMAQDTDGGFWIGVAHGRLLHLDARDSVIDERWIPGGIASLVAAPEGGIWLGGEGVVWRLRGESLERFGPEAGVPRGSVRDLLPDADGGVWIASYGGGLGRWVAGRVASITRDEGLPDVTLSRILDDGLGRLWLLSNSGLIVAPRLQFVEVAEGGSARLDPVLLGLEAGGAEANYDSPAGFRAESGELIFGTISGAVRVDPREFPFNSLAPTVRIERVLADERALATVAEMQVPARTRRLSFEFTAFALSVPERVHFRHRLVGFDPDWIDIGSDRATNYTTLPPGAYVLEVAARNEHGVWSDAPARLQFEVLAAWWQKPSIQALGMAALLLAVLMAHRLRVDALQRRSAILLAATEGRRSAEARESRLREDLAHLARVNTAGELATSLAHEVNQPLAAIVNNARAGHRLLQLGRSDPRELGEILVDIARQGERASEVIRRLRDFLGKHESSRQAVDVGQLMRETLPLVRRELEDLHVETVLAIAPKLPAVQADSVQLQQVLVNLIKNACDSLAQSEVRRRIELKVEARDGRVAISVRDNGPGLAPEVRERVFEPYVTTKSAGMGLGLAICRTIVESHGGRLELASPLGPGAEFRVELPFPSPA